MFEIFTCLWIPPNSLFKICKELVVLTCWLQLKVKNGTHRTHTWVLLTLKAIIMAIFKELYWCYGSLLSWRNDNNFFTNV